MAKSLEFGRSMLVMDADDAKLEAALKADEQLVSQSVNKMQGNLNKLEVSMQGTGDAAGVATTGVSALSAAAAATGSTSLMAASQIGNLGVALRSVGDTAVGASAQLVIMAKSTLAFIATPVGMAVVAIAAAFGALALAIRSVNKEMEDELKLMQELAERDIAALEQRIKWQERVAAVADKVAVAEGKMSKQRARLRELIRAEPETTHEQRLKLVETEQRLAQLGRQAESSKAREARIAAAIARTEKDRLAAEQERLRVAEALASAAEAEARALTARAGPQTPEEARTMVREQIELENARQRGIFNLLRLQETTQRGGERYEAIEELLGRFGGRFGAAAPTTTTRFGQGALELSAFAATGRRGPAAAAGPDPVQAARIAKEDKRTKAAEATARNTERLAIAFGRWNPGAR